MHPGTPPHTQPEIWPIFMLWAHKRPCYKRPFGNPFPITACVAAFRACLSCLWSNREIKQRLFRRCFERGGCGHLTIFIAFISTRKNLNYSSFMLVHGFCYVSISHYFGLWLFVPFDMKTHTCRASRRICKFFFARDHHVVFSGPQFFLSLRNMPVRLTWARVVEVCGEHAFFLWIG